MYSDGRAIADASRTLTLTATELSDLVGTLRRDLAGLDGSVKSNSRVQIMDAETTTIKVLAPDFRLKMVSAYALGDGHPARLLAAQDRLSALTDSILRDGNAYTTDRVRLVVYPHRDYDSVAGEITPWPAAVDFPPAAGDGYEGVRWIDLADEAARDVAATMPGGPEDEMFKRVVTAPDGANYRVGWRYLLPDE